MDGEKKSQKKRKTGLMEEKPSNYATTIPATTTPDTTTTTIPATTTTITDNETDLGMSFRLFIFPLYLPFFLNLPTKQKQFAPLVTKKSVFTTHTCTIDLFTFRPQRTFQVLSLLLSWHLGRASPCCVGGRSRVVSFPSQYQTAGVFASLTSEQHTNDALVKNNLHTF